LSTSLPRTGGTSSGEGRYAITASSSGCTPCSRAAAGGPSLS
jgi:hypothetical protein